MVEQTADGSDQPVGSGKTPGWSFMLWWVLASVVGGVASVGMILGAYVGAGQIMGDVVAVILGWVLVGVGIGVAQWVVLRGHVARAGWWVLASGVGGVVDVIVGQVVGVGGVGGLLVGVVGGVVGLVIYGGITGFVMVRLLRQGAAGDDAVAASA